MTQQGPVANHSPTAAATLHDKPPELKLQPDFQPRAGDHYHINDLLPYHDRVFVQVAYRAVLKRSPDQTESLRDLRRLRSGHINKILERMRKGYDCNSVLSNEYRFTSISRKT